MDRKTLIPLVLVVTLLCCVCVCVAAIFGGALYFASQAATATPFLPPLGPIPTTAPFFATPTPVPVINSTPVPTPLPGASDTLNTLQEEDVPFNDLRLLAMRLKGIPDIPEVVSTTSADHQVGDEVKFYASNTDTNASFELTARLAYKTDNSYFFVEDGVRVDENDVKALMDEFQNQAYTTVREFFGSEPNPGIDGDPHLYVLYARGLGFSVAGFQSSADGYSSLAHEFSNEKEMFYINADNTSPGDPSLVHVLAHEFQHMVQGHQDGNEETWMNEGSSVLAQFLNGDRAIFFDSSFTLDPDLQLNAWTEGGANDNSGPHYGAGFLYMAYFLDRFGAEATKALVGDQANGLKAVDEVLKAQGMTDAATGQPITANDLFADWVIANYLQDKDVADGRYYYHNYPDMPKIGYPTDTIFSCPNGPYSATVHQYAADYYEINCSGSITLNFLGSLQVGVTPTDPHSGRYAFWSNRADKSDMTLTREFDLSGVTSATLNYWTWWAIEEDYDYGYVEVSTDGGATWKILKTPGGTDYNPTGNAFGWAYNNNSGGDPSQWVQESVDLSDYAGEKIQVRFEYITDDAVNRPGWLIDDIEIPELNYSEDFESGDGDWNGEGFVRIDNVLPQKFIVQVIHHGNFSADTTIERMQLDAANSGSITLNLSSGQKATLVVSGVTPFTTELASYQFEIR
jgi:hypothetical protein